MGFHRTRADYWIPLASFVLAVLLAFLGGPTPTSARVRLQAQQSKTGEAEHKIKVPPVDNSDEPGYARGVAQVKPGSAGTVTGFTLNSVKLTIVAPDGSKTIEDVTHAAVLTPNGTGTSLAAYKVEMSSTWNDLGGVLLTQGNVTAFYEFEVTAHCTVNGTAESITRRGSGKLNIK
jgi:hypothetical protein